MDAPENEPGKESRDRQVVGGGEEESGETALRAGSSFSSKSGTHVKSVDRSFSRVESLQFLA